MNSSRLRSGMRLQAIALATFENRPWEDLSGKPLDDATLATLSEEEHFALLGRRADQIIKEAQIKPDEITAMLVASDAPAVQSDEILKSIADHCTLYALDYRAVAKLRAKKLPSHDRQAANAISTLRRVLPGVIDFAQFVKDEARAAAFRALLAAVANPSLSFPRRSRLNWHSAALGLAGLYNKHIDPSAKWSRNTPGIKFLAAALERMRIPHPTEDALEKLLDRRSPDSESRFPGIRFPGDHERGGDSRQNRIC